MPPLWYSCSSFMSSLFSLPHPPLLPATSHSLLCSFFYFLMLKETLPLQEKLLMFEFGALGPFFLHLSFLSFPHWLSRETTHYLDPETCWLSLQHSLANSASHTDVQDHLYRKPAFVEFGFALQLFFSFLSCFIEVPELSYAYKVDFSIWWK